MVLSYESGEIAKEGETAADGGETCKKRIVRIFFFVAIALAVVGTLWMIFGRWFY